MIYDCFVFYNELDLLELRLNILADAVDHFVIGESDYTFSGKKKDLIFWKNRKRFKEFHHKIVHTCIPSEGTNSWERERHQRNSLLNQIWPRPDDIVLISDVDEIPRPELLANIEQPTTFIQAFYYFCVDLAVGETWGPWRGTTGSKFKYMSTPELLRATRGAGALDIENGGWHFSCLGGPEMICQKIQAFSHTELDTPLFTDQEKILQRILNQSDPFDRGGSLTKVPIDETYPQYLRDNLDKYPHFLSNYYVV